MKRHIFNKATCEALHLEAFQNGGFSINNKAERPKDGYIVSFEDYSVTAKSRVFTVNMIKNFADALAKNDMLQYDWIYVGCWFNKENDTYYLDASMHTTDRETAISTGKAQKQIAIWDVLNECEIRL